MLRYALLALALTLTLALAPCNQPWAQAYPSRTVRLIVPFAPGGGTDIIARSLAQRLTEGTGQQFIVDNRAGGNAQIGTELVAKAAPDGYTLLITTNIFTINPWLHPNAPFNAERDFAPVTQFGSTPNLLAIHPSIPVRSVKEFLALARARPGQLTIATAGNSTPSHLASELLKQVTKIDLLIVHYKGAGASLNDVVGGQVALSFTTLASLLPFVKSGRLRPLAVSGAQRAALVPDVPALVESLPGFEVLTWYGLFAPIAVRREIVTRLHGETLKALATADMQQRLAAQGFDRHGNTPEEFAGVIRRDLAKWQKVIADAKIRAE